MPNAKTGKIYKIKSLKGFILNTILISERQVKCLPLMALQDSSLQFPQLLFTYFRFRSTEVAHQSGPCKSPFFPFLVPTLVHFLYSFPLKMNGNLQVLFFTFPESVEHGGDFFKDSAY